jgi:ubiquitin C-terminal hydrolase
MKSTGKFVGEYSNLLESIESGQHRICNPNPFRKLFIQRHSYFTEKLQHDSNEFLNDMLKAFANDLFRGKENDKTHGLEGFENSEGMDSA